MLSMVGKAEYSIAGELPFSPARAAVFGRAWIPSSAIILYTMHLVGRCTVCAMLAATLSPFDYVHESERGSIRALTPAKMKAEAAAAAHAAVQADRTGAVAGESRGPRSASH